MEPGSIEAIRERVAAGLGCSIVPSMAVTAAHHRCGLEVQPLAPELSRTPGLVLRQDKPVGVGLRKVVEALEGLAQSRSGAPSGNSGR
ncbi:LysR family transcriptional regulator substrate-binding protein [Metapseudomonas lalkuanensis]|uniref:LysR family transcriptional regulator substrate-binding protein n=1 Tax=Metapseudomonas lalkuanensis TaxID=2604832 RepID=A0A5J6QPX5_9GAMM|nr:LysR family transcriptional regulator substrate-binding protein [Pseudomonas lalkuanensis]